MAATGGTVGIARLEPRKSPMSMSKGTLPEERKDGWWGEATGGRGGIFKKKRAHIKVRGRKRSVCDACGG